MYESADPSHPFESWRIDILKCRRGHALRLRRQLTERAMRPVAGVVVDVFVDHSFEVSTTEDEHPVETFTSDSPDKALGEGVGRGALTGDRTMRTPGALKTSSKLAVNLASRSRIKNLTGRARWASSYGRISGLLDDPVASRIRRCSHQEDLSDVKLDEEEEVEPSQQDGVDLKK
jgi:hypothetical protein